MSPMKWLVDFLPNSKTMPRRLETLGMTKACPKTQMRRDHAEKAARIPEFFLLVVTSIVHYATAWKHSQTWQGKQPNSVQMIITDKRAKTFFFSNIVPFFKNLLNNPKFILEYVKKTMIRPWLGAPLPTHTPPPPQTHSCNDPALDGQCWLCRIFPLLSPLLTTTCQSPGSQHTCPL